MRLVFTDVRSSSVIFLSATQSFEQDGAVYNFRRSIASFHSYPKFTILLPSHINIIDCFSKKWPWRLTYAPICDHDSKPHKFKAHHHGCSLLFVLLYSKSGQLKLLNRSAWKLSCSFYNVYVEWNRRRSVRHLLRAIEYTKHNMYPTIDSSLIRKVERVTALFTKTRMMIDP